jgi:hypothetical protein
LWCMSNDVRCARGSLLRGLTACGLSLCVDVKLTNDDCAKTNCCSRRKRQRLILEKQEFQR